MLLVPKHLSLGKGCLEMTYLALPVQKIAPLSKINLNTAFKRYFACDK